jgi:two-component system, NtrC family, nitrogen regulation sensor histidine kinase NtrY
MADTDHTLESAQAERLYAWARRSSLGNKLSIALVIGAIGSGAMTYAVLTGAGPVSPSPRVILFLLFVNLVLVMVLGAIIARRLVHLWVARRAGSAGSRLQVRMVVLFSILAVVPTIFVGLFSGLYFHLGLEAWFSDHVRTVLQESVQASEVYIEEHRKVVRADVLAMANDLNRLSPDVAAGRVNLAEIVATQAALRSLTEAVVFNSSGQILAKTRFSFGVGIDTLPDGALKQAATGDVVILTSDSEDRVRALVNLDRYIDGYLFVGRFVDSRVLGHAARAGAAMEEYEEREGARSEIEITFTLIFMVVGILVLLAAVWLGLWFSNLMVAPVGRLVSAVERVRAGDYSSRVDEGREDDEIATLSRAFNRMTDQIESQQNELTEANTQLDLRRRFTEAVLSGVTAGVIGVDSKGIINLPNSSAIELVGAPANELIGHRFDEAIPEMGPLLEEARRLRGRTARSQVTLERNGVSRDLLVRVVAQWSRRGAGGYVVTFDDLTDLLVAQRRAAWGDIARRIAHEIKNPLTPIQLSAERLRRKYKGEVRSDPDVFDQCTDTIIRQVTDIGRMVDEFTEFVRMPGAEFHNEDVSDLVRQAVFLQQVAHPSIEFDIVAPETTVVVPCDGRQVLRALTNLTKNAAESLTGRRSDSDGAGGHVEIELIERPEDVVIEIRDNGPGFPSALRDRLTEPYVTTRTKGTGLGLAIVQKVMEEHHGTLELTDRPEGGALARLTFIRNLVQADRDDENDGSVKNPIKEQKVFSHGT